MRLVIATADSGQELHLGETAGSTEPIVEPELGVQE